MISRKLSSRELRATSFEPQNPRLVFSLFSRVTRHASRILVVLLLVAPGCRCPWSGKRPAGPAAVLGAADAAVADMALAKTATWPAARLYDYMDGAAEAYFARGFVVLATAETKWRTTEARIELFQVKSRADAKGLFDEFNDGKGRKLPAGIASAAWDARELEGIFYRGSFFCRLIIYGNDKEARDLLDALAAAIDKSMSE